MTSLQMIVTLGLLILHFANGGQANGDIVSQNDPCPNTWTRSVNTTDNNVTCECGDSLGGLVSCDPETNQVLVTACYCMTMKSTAENEIVFGPCPYTCNNTITLNGRVITSVYDIPKNKSMLSDKICGPWNREGQQCRDCKEGYATPFLSYDIGCIECNATDIVTGWVKLIAVGVLPPTILFFLVITLRLNINSPNVIGFIFFVQCISSDQIIENTYIAFGSNINQYKTLIDIVFSFYGLFNLNFFHTLLPPFCIYGQYTSGKLAIHLTLALYPLLLAASAYLLVELHARNVRFVVCLWRPFHRCFVHIRRGGNIQTTIVDAFATIFQLSYTKMLIACTNYITITKLYDVYGNVICTEYPYISQNEYCSLQRSAVEIVVILIIILIVIVLPVMLMLLYPMKCFQTCLQKFCCCKGRSQIMLKTFMDCFHGHFKDGTNGTRDCRYVAGFYYLIRILLYFLYAFVSQTTSIIPMLVALVMISALIIALIGPYREQNKMNNITDPLFLFLGGLLGLGIILYWNWFRTHTKWAKSMAYVCTTVVAILPIIYIATIILMHFYHMSVTQRALRSIRSVCHRCRQSLGEKRQTNHTQDRCIHQFHNESEYGTM